MSIHVDYTYDLLIVGAGLFGATFARLATDAGYKCLVIDQSHPTHCNHTWILTAIYPRSRAILPRKRPDKQQSLCQIQDTRWPRTRHHLWRTTRWIPILQHGPSHSQRNEKVGRIPKLLKHCWERFRPCNVLTSWWYNSRLSIQGIIFSNILYIRALRGRRKRAPRQRYGRSSQGGLQENVWEYQVPVYIYFLGVRNAELLLSEAAIHKIS